MKTRKGIIDSSGSNGIPKHSNDADRALRHSNSSVLTCDRPDARVTFLHLAT